MKFPFVLIALIAASISFSAKRMQTPPGTVKISDNFYFDQTEVTNFSWLEYIQWNKSKYGETSEQYINSLPDTSVWGDQAAMVSNYLRHPAFLNYPVVGITYDQATAYCAWRSKRVNEMFFAKKYKVAYHYYKVDSNFTQIPQLVEYRLPTAEEWEQVYTVGYSKKANRKIAAHGHLRRKNGYGGLSTTAPSDADWPNLYELHFLNGNVSEMIAERGMAKGENWQNNAKRTYRQGTNWLGFRCVCTYPQD